MTTQKDVFAYQMKTFQTRISHNKGDAATIRHEIHWLFLRFFFVIHSIIFADLSGVSCLISCDASCKKNVDQQNNQIARFRWHKFHIELISMKFVIIVFTYIGIYSENIHRHTHTQIMVRSAMSSIETVMWFEDYFQKAKLFVSFLVRLKPSNKFRWQFGWITAPNERQ